MSSTTALDHWIEIILVEEAHERSRARERTGARVRAAAWTGSRACTSSPLPQGQGRFGRHGHEKPVPPGG